MTTIRTYLIDNGPRFAGDFCCFKSSQKLYVFSQPMSEQNLGHPLFPPKDDDEPTDIQSLQLFRVENGTKVFVPKHFNPQDLQSEIDIFNMYGGGTYELLSRGTLSGGRHGITGKRGFVLPGPSKPLFDAPPKTVDASSAVPVAQQAANGAGSPTWLPIMATLLPLLLQWLSGQQESARMDRQSQQALLTAMMKQGQDSNAQMITLLATLKQPGGSGDGAQFREGMKFMQEFVAGQMETLEAQKKESGESEDIMQTIGQLSQFAELINKFSGEPPVVSNPTTTTTATEVPG